MANTDTPGGCAGGCGRPVPANRVLCPLCSATVAASTPIGWSAPTVNVAAQPTLRVPAYVGQAA